ncbi:unnamed protein product [Acanthosepion pharaonis]|uniref:Uncharacterized protein n=1 Tax=Acanthosepion pharaonis TaxID=158019 RepID=A0A812BAG9_ACAPH|nr:unnamed protein product [Sepia pharaonis]
MPYCPLVVKSFNAHINVEYCHSVRSIKYVCKYINKGTDAAMFGIRQEGSVDEIQDFLAGRVISSTANPWHIFSFPIHERFPAIVQLAVHLENDELRYFSADVAMNVAARTKDTTLTAFFKLCRQDEFARTLLYPDVPSYYVWTKKNTWARRKGRANVEGYPGVKKTLHSEGYSRFPIATGMFFYLRLLLHEVSGPTSYNNLRTVNGVLYDTFREACLRLGLLGDDSQWDATMAEGALLKMPFALRHLFTTILQMCEPSDPKSLWDKYKDFLSEDILREAQLLCPTMALTFNDGIYNRALIIIENLFVEMMGGSLAAIGLPTPDRVTSSSLSPEIVRETSYSVEELNAYVTKNEPKLTMRQLHLTTNMRAHLTGDVGSAEFSNTLLALGEGIIPADTNGFVNVQGLSTVFTTPATLMESVFPDLQTNYNNIEWLAGRAILATPKTPL